MLLPLFFSIFIGVVNHLVLLSLIGLDQRTTLKEEVWYLGHGTIDTDQSLAVNFGVRYFFLSVFVHDRDVYINQFISLFIVYI